MKLFTLSLSIALLTATVACGKAGDTTPKQETAATSTTTAPAPVAAKPAEPAPEGVRQIDINISGMDYTPASVNVTKGEKVRLRFHLDDKPTCGQTVVFPELNIKKDVPVNGSSFVDLTAEKTGDINFTCGMNMMKGKVVVQ